MAENKVDNTNVANDKKKNKGNKTRRNIILLIFALALFIMFIAFRGNYLEILGIGENYTDVFIQNIKYTGITMVINFIILYLIVYFVNSRIKKGLEEFFGKEKKTMPKLVNKSIAFTIALVVSLVTAKLITSKVMICINATSFNMSDPIFGMDIGFFVMQKPFVEFVLAYLLIITIVMAVYTAIYYIIVFNKYFDGIDREILRNSKFISQLLKFVMIIGVLIAALFFFNTYNMGTDKLLELSMSNTSKDTSKFTVLGSGYTDVHIKLWGYRIFAVVIIIAIYRAIKAFKNKNTKKILKNISIIPGYLIVMFIVLVSYQGIFVSSNELDKEKKYLADNIENTQNAYGINIDEINITETEELTTETANSNKDTLDNIAIVSDTITKKDLNSSQTSKGYYYYNNTQLEEYNIDGKNKLVYVSPRELITTGDATYNTKTYEYTHGYGTIISSGVNTSETGNIEYIQKSFDTSNYKLKVQEPRIYFGTTTNSTVVTNSKNKKEFDYPILDSENIDNAENEYNGTAGLSLNLFDRLILAIKEKDLNLAFSGNLNEESKIITNRNIINRAKTIMPGLVYDENPYMVISDEGKQIWVLDAYTVSNDYPYSQRTTIRANGEKKEINYIRNSVKVLIDAYDGTVKFYITDRTDPIIMAYRNIYPNVFEELENQIPEDISKHFVYPKYLYDIQSEILKTHHNVQTEVLYRGDDVWTDATHNTNKNLSKTGTNLESYYTMVKTVDSDEAKLGLVKMYTQYEKQSLTSYLVGKSDNGKLSLKLYKFASDSNVLGTMQLDTQIEQDEQISKEIQGLYVTGTRIIREMVVVPINNSLLYVEPIYQQYINEQDALPTLKKVVVSTGNKVAIGDNLESAMQNLLSKATAVEIEVDNTDDLEGLIRAIIKANNNLKDSNDNNDWEMIGKDLNKLQTLINELETDVKKQDEETKKNKNNQTENVTETNESSADEEANNLIDYFLNSHKENKTRK